MTAKKYNRNRKGASKGSMGLLFLNQAFVTEVTALKLHSGLQDIMIRHRDKQIKKLEKQVKQLKQELENRKG